MRLLVAVMLLVVPLSGCTILDDLTRPNISVSRTDLGAANEFGYVTTNVFSVSVLDPGGAIVAITATSRDGASISNSGLATRDDLVSITLTDGTWTVSYTVDGHDWETFKNVRIDGTPPATDSLITFGKAQDGAYTLGSAYVLEADTTIEVIDAGGRVIARSLPHTVTGLSGGIHFFVIQITDGAGNTASKTVQVAAGDAKLLPEGEHTFGIVARYTNDARLWDLSDLDAYNTPAQARAATGDSWTGEGFGITPSDPEVQAVVDEVVDGGTTAEIAFDLFVWLMDELEYTEERLDEDDLLEPSQTFANGGGVCRDLAAAYVSLLRAAGVPSRLVSGYLAGNVDGFHAWVEVYVGSVGGQDPWMPVDVSPIDGRYTGDANGDGVDDGLGTVVQSFGIALPQYLALRKIPEASEDEGWSTALGTSYSYPDGSPPELSFEKDLTDIGEPVEGLLCFDPATIERKFASRTTECQGMYVIGRDTSDPDFRNNNPFIIGTQRIIDYGVELQSASGDTTIEMSLSYPFPRDVRPDTVEWQPYSNTPPGFTLDQEAPDPVTGKIIATISS